MSLCFGQSPSRTGGSEYLLPSPATDMDHQFFYSIPEAEFSQQNSINKLEIDDSLKRTNERASDRTLACVRCRHGEDDEIRQTDETPPRRDATTVLCCTYSRCRKSSEIGRSVGRLVGVECQLKDKDKSVNPSALVGHCHWHDIISTARLL
jgi:hypothetical protein